MILSVSAGILITLVIVYAIATRQVAKEQKGGQSKDYDIRNW